MRILRSKLISPVPRESIAQITPELLYTCYNTFYNPRNMVLAIAGNFDPDQAIAIIEKNLVDKEPVEIERSPIRNGEKHSVRVPT